MVCHMSTANYSSDTQMFRLWLVNNAVITLSSSGNYILSNAVKATVIPIIAYIYIYLGGGGVNECAETAGTITDRSHNVYLQH